VQPLTEARAAFAGALAVDFVARFKTEALVAEWYEPDIELLGYGVLMALNTTSLTRASWFRVFP
jgi:hypothetical protein